MTLVVNRSDGMTGSAHTTSKAQRKKDRMLHNMLYRFSKIQRKNFTKLMGMFRRRLKDAGDPDPIRDAGFVLKLIPIEECEQVILAYADMAAKQKDYRAVIGGLAEDGFYVLGLPNEEYDRHAEYYQIGPVDQDAGEPDQKNSSFSIRVPVGSPEGSVETPGEDQEGADQ